MQYMLYVQVLLADCSDILVIDKKKKDQLSG